MYSLRVALQSRVRYAGGPRRQFRSASEPAWAAEARRKYEEDQRRRAARKAQAQAEAPKQDYTSLEGTEDIEGKVDSLPVMQGDWLAFLSNDSFPTDVMEAWNPTEDPSIGIRTLEEAKHHCIRMGYGGFTQKWQFIYCFKGIHPRKLVAGRTAVPPDSKGVFNLYVPTAFEGVKTIDDEMQKKIDVAIENGTMPTEADITNELNDNLENEDWGEDWPKDKDPDKEPERPKDKDPERPKDKDPERPKDKDPEQPSDKKKAEDVKRWPHDYDLNNKEEMEQLKEVLTKKIMRMSSHTPESARILAEKLFNLTARFPEDYIPNYKPKYDPDDDFDIDPIMPKRKKRILRRKRRGPASSDGKCVDPNDVDLFSQTGIRVVANRDIRVKGVLRIPEGCEGTVVGPAKSGDPRRIHVHWHGPNLPMSNHLNVTEDEFEIDSRFDYSDFWFER